MGADEATYKLLKLWHVTELYPPDYGGGAESVDRGKRRRIVRAAQLFLLQHPALAEDYCRFDVVDASGDPEAPDFTWHRDAFSVDEA